MTSRVGVDKGEKQTKRKTSKTVHSMGYAQKTLAGVGCLRETSASGVPPIGDMIAERQAEILAAEKAVGEIT